VVVDAADGVLTFTRTRIAAAEPAAA
jgi:hypothetical protein